MIKAIIFDCFGVLAGSGFKEIYRSAGGNLAKDSEFIDQVLARANQGLMHSHEMHQKVADRLGMSHDEWRGVVNRGELPNEELLAYIKQLKDTYKIAILSNANIGTLERKFSDDQLALFDVHVVSAEVGMMKPDAGIYKLAAEKLDVDTSECIFIDDSLGYCHAAEDVGMKAICYKDFGQFKTELEQILSQS